MQEDNEHNQRELEVADQNSINVDEPSTERVTDEASTMSPQADAVSSSSQAVVRQPKNWKKIIIIAVIALVVLAAAGVAYWLLVLKKDPATPAVSNATPAKEEEKKEKPKTQEEVDQALAKFITPTTGESWLSAPKLVGDQKFLKSIDPAYPREVKYYEVGSRAGKTIYMSVEQMLGDVIYLYEKGSDGSVVAVVRPDGAATYNEDNEKYQSDEFSANVTINKDIHYDSLTLPEKISLPSGYTVSRSKYSYNGDFIHKEDANSESGSKYTLVNKYGGSKLEKYEYSYVDTNLTTVGYTMTLPINTRISMTYEPLELDMSNFQFTTGDSSVEDRLSAISRGCGNRFASVSISTVLKESDVKVVGKSGSGQQVYELVNPNHPLLTKAFEEFVQFYKDDPNSNKKDVTKTQFIKSHGLVIYKDKQGQWLVYTRDEYRPVAGCAKPVVYLYPTSTQVVSVKVGADVKISDPYYDKKAGWKVIAKPNGQLTVGGQSYESLFWEGPGQGEYPGIQSGTVVETSDAIATIRQQLAQQGLNSKEIDDFVLYWEPNLPEKPYIRLTWLSTQQLNELAPLQIAPKPDTVIRVFLDFAGLDTPIAIQPQTFTAPARNGFTVVEWGGLSNKKLY